MGGAIVLIGIMPLINTSEVRSSYFRPLFRIFYWLFVGNFLILGWIGQKAVETPYIEVGQFATFFYFIFYLAVPIIGIVEKQLMTHKL